MSLAKKQKLDNEVEGYIVDVTTPSVSKKTPNVTYFNFTLQTSPEHYAKGVVFTSEKHQSFVNAKEAKSPLKLTEVKKELSFTSSSGYEVKCTRGTTLVPTKLDFTCRANTRPCKELQIKDVIESAPVESFVTITAKVLEKEEPVTKTTRFGKSILLTMASLADQTSKIDVALWDTDGLKLNVGHSYKLHMLTVKNLGIKSLSTTSASTVTEIPDIGPINELGQEEQNLETVKGTTTTVSFMTKHFCLHCSSPITINDPSRSVIACLKCNQKMLQQKLKPTITLKMDFDNLFVTAFNDVIVSMLKNEAKEHLLEDLEQLELLLLQSTVEITHLNGIVKTMKLC